MITATDLITAWSRPVQPVVCDTCDTTYLLADLLPDDVTCPNCFKGALQPFDEGLENLPTIAAPEQIGRFTLKEELLHREFRRFVASVKYPPADLTAETLAQRAQREFLPIWLVDTDVVATWRAKLGFTYEVESFTSHYNNGSWRSRKVIEKKLDWEPRAGRIEHQFANSETHALNDHKHVLKPIGDSIRTAAPYSSDAINNAAIRLPDISQTDGIRIIEEAVRPVAEKLCREAAGGAQIDDYYWQPDLTNQNWTLLLVPSYVSYYLDDESVPRRVRVHGQTGKVAGIRRQSELFARQRAQRETLQIVGIAVVALLIALFAPLEPELERFILFGILLFGGIMVFNSIKQIFDARALNLQHALQDP
jgi:hypothetical protein